MQQNSFSPVRASVVVLVVALAMIAAVLAGVTTIASAQGPERIYYSSVDGQNSLESWRLHDGNTPTDGQSNWRNPNPWQPANYPMTAILDLGATRELSTIRYFVGNLTQPVSVTFEASTSSSGDNFSAIATRNSGHTWGTWSEIGLQGQTARRLRVRFNSIEDHFTIAEIEVFAAAGGPSTTTTSSTTSSTTVPVSTSTSTTSTTTTPPATTTTTVAPGSDPHPQTNGVIDSFGEMSLEQGLATFGAGRGPGWAKVDEYFAENPRRPGECDKATHNRFWVLGADGDIHPTHHHAQELGCAMAHEHGDDPRGSSLYGLSGGIPFGMLTSADDSLGRTEGHAGHKITRQDGWQLVEGNPQDGTAITLTGITCNWLSKVHQGSSTSDALGSNAHEYFLNQSCSDGTTMAIKTIPTWGPVGQVTDIGCGATNEAFATNIHGHHARAVEHFNDGKREFECIDAVIGRHAADPFVELWKPDGHLSTPAGGFVIYSPYYVLLNPSRYVDNEWASRGMPNAYMSTVDLCFQDNPSYRYDKDHPYFCQFVPQSLAGLSSADRQRSPLNPMNGARRVVHPKEVFIKTQSEPGSGLLRFCSDAQGDNPQYQTNGSCPAGTVLQVVSRTNRGEFNNFNGSNVNARFENGQWFGAGYLNEWTRDYDDPTIRFPN